MQDVIEALEAITNTERLMLFWKAHIDIAGMKNKRRKIIIRHYVEQLGSQKSVEVQQTFLDWVGDGTKKY